MIDIDILMSICCCDDYLFCSKVICICIVLLILSYFFYLQYLGSLGRIIYLLVMYSCNYRYYYWVCFCLKLIYLIF